MSCGSDITADLTGLGDINSATDATLCAQDSGGCADGTLRDGKPRAISIQLIKQADGSWAYAGTGCQVITPGRRPVVTAAMVRDRVVRLIPTAKLGLAPHDTTLVNIQTIMWVAAPRAQQLPPLTILGQGVTVKITLDHVDWTFGDGRSSSTRGPGKTYDNTHDPCRTAQCPDYFGHTYRVSGPATVHATATWTARFTVAGSQAATIPGTVAGPTAADTVNVKQARAVLIPDPGRG